MQGRCLIRHSLLRERRPGGRDLVEPVASPAEIIFVTLLLLVFLPAFVEELGVAAVIVAAQERTVTDLHKTVLLEDPLHAVVVGQGRAADGREPQGVEDVVEEEGDGLGGVAPTAKVSGSDLYSELAAVAAEVVESRHADRVPSGLYDKGLDARILPTGEVVAAGRRKRDGDG